MTDDLALYAFPVLAVCLLALLVLLRRARTRPAEWAADLGWRDSMPVETV